MTTIKGTYAEAVLYLSGNTETALHPLASAQIRSLCDNPASEGSRIRIMPDVHPGKPCTVGLTMTVGKKLMPAIVGVDIGCGMRLAKLRSGKIEPQKLDKVIRENIPSGFGSRDKLHRYAEEFDLSSLHCFQHIHAERALRGLGTLGGGNHFIELDKDDEGDVYVILHSGSRNLGLEVTEYYLKKGQELHKEAGEDVPYQLTCLQGELLQCYTDDLLIVQRFAERNRAAMMDILAKEMKFKFSEEYECIHNYLDTETVLEGNKVSVIRKGAISAKKGEKVIIPVNMKDGVILGRGRGKESWNCSAPHGAGRICARTEVKERFTVSDFKKEMKGIYSTCVNGSTLDEAPFAYRRIDDIRDVIGETVEIDRILKPIYNFKEGEKE